MYPPYFYISSCQNDYKKERKQLDLNNWIKERIPEEAISNEKIFHLMKICVAYFV